VAIGGPLEAAAFVDQARDQERFEATLSQAMEDGMVADASIA